MIVYDIAKLLSENSYAGRGILLGKTADGEHAALAYFIMGRSENSRNRVFLPDGDGLRIEAFDPAKLADPRLIIYRPVRVRGNQTVVTNGDQTDTVYDALAAGKTFEDALKTRCFEPDAPNFTPRVSGLVTLGGDFSYKLSILRSRDADGSGCDRFTYEYDPADGFGHFIHTYRCDGNPIPSFTGEPEKVRIGDDLDEFTALLWDNLNAANKVALFTRFIDLSTGAADSRIVNKNR